MMNAVPWAVWLGSYRHPHVAAEAGQVGVAGFGLEFGGGVAAGG